MKKGKSDAMNEVQLPDKVSEPALLYAVRQNTIDIMHLENLKNISCLKDDILSHSLNLNVKTYRSYKTKPVSMKPYLQEHILGLLSLYKHGISVFGGQELFNEWLAKDNYYFDNDAPIDFLTTISGIKYIDDRLTALEYGDNI